MCSVSNMGKKNEDAENIQEERSKIHYVMGKGFSRFCTQQAMHVIHSGISIHQFDRTQLKQTFPDHTGPCNILHFFLMLLICAVVCSSAAV